MSARTRIEALIGRELIREKRAGVTHFMPGQLEARMLIDSEVGADANAYELSYVDQMGHAWLVFVADDDGEWITLAAIRGGQTFAGERDAPALTDSMREQLEQARRRAVPSGRNG